MLPLEVVFAALFGLAFGSFLNVCIVRLPRGESVVHPGSRCPSCHQPIAVRDNVPLVSWLLLRGRSRCCGEPIALRYPLVEALTAIVFVSCLLRFGISIAGIGMAVLGWLLLGLAWMDAETFLLPDSFTLPGLALGLVYQSLHSGIGWHAAFAVLYGMLSAALVGGFLLFAAWLYRLVRGREGMGMGDVKLAAMLGAWFGWQVACVALFIGVMAGAVAGTLLTFLGPAEVTNEKAQGPWGLLRFPLGSCLASAGIVTIFCGQRLLAWYLHFFQLN